MSDYLELINMTFRCVSDCVVEATEVVRELEESNDGIDEVVEKVTLKRKQTRPRRTCAPSVKVLEQAALPSGSESAVTTCDDFEDM